MAELMKRYRGGGVLEMNDFEKNMWQEIRMLREKFSILKLENDKLKEQLRWRPVSEKPEKDGRYFAEVKPYTGCESTIITTAYFDGERFLWHDVVRWLPIPPALEGE